MGCTQSTSCIRRRRVNNGLGEGADGLLCDIRRDDFKLGKLLGSGAFGQVRECVHRESKEVYALKIMVKTSNEKGHWSNENMFRREVAVLATLDHPYVVKYHYFFEDKNYLYAVLEKCSGGELFDLILREGTLEESRSAILVYQMLNAIKYVHSQGVVHRDVKAENFLFTSSNVALSTIKLIDFGMSERLTDESQMLSDVCGSPHYLAPELIRRKYSFKADVWALGVLVYLMLYGKYPFDGNTTSTIVKEILTKKIEWSGSAGKPAVSQLAQSFLKTILQRNPEKRPTASEAIKHPWLAEARSHFSPKLSSPRLTSLIGSGDDEEDIDEGPVDIDIDKRDLIVIGNEETRFSQLHIT